MGTSLSSILKKKKVLENNDDTYESESNSTVSGIPSFEESQKTRKSDLRSLLQAKKDKEKLVELQNEQKRQERQDWLRKSSTSQHTTAMTDFIRSDREKVAESSIPMADAVKQYNQIKQQKWMLNEAQYENDLLQEYRKRKRIEKEQQEAKDKVGFQDGDTFIQYTDIPQQKDFADTVKKAKENAAKANDQYAFMYNNKKLPFGDKGLTIGGKKLTLGGKESNPVESYVNTFGDGKNVFGKSSVLDITSGQDNAKSPLRRYALLNDSERDIYDYLFERQGKDTAEKYLDSIQGELNQRGAEANYEHNNQYKGPIKTIVNTTQSIGAGMQNAVEGIKSIPDFAMGTRKNAMPTESELSQTKMLENAGTIDGFTYKMANAIGNMIPSIIVGGAGGPAVSSAIFAAQTGGQSYRQDIMDGRPVEGAQVNAVLTAADETVTNLLLGGISQYGGGFIKKTLGNTKVAQAAKQGITSALAKNPAVRRAVLGVINYGSDMLSEGTQEAVQDLTESIRKHFIYGDELDLTGDLTDPQTWEDFLLGAATAGIMNAPATIANNVAINNYGKNLDVDYRDYSEGIDTDQTHYTNPADAKEAQGLQRMAEEYAAMQRQGKFVNNRDKAEYDMRLWEWQNRMAEEQKGQDEQTLQAQGQPTQPQEQAIQSQKQASQNQEYTNRSQQENQAEPTAQETIQNSDVKRPTEQSVQPEYESTPLERQDNQIQEEHQTDSPEKPYAAPKATQEQPQATAAHNSEQDTINAQENEHRNPQSNFEAEDNVKLSDQESTEYKSHYGKYGGDALLNTYDGSVDVSTFNKAFGRAYDAGYNQIDLDTATHSALMSLLSDQQIEAAYRAGIQDYNLDNQVKPKYTQGQIKEGGLGTVSDYATQDQRNVAEHIGKKTGLKINLVDNLSQENATASYKPGEITININSEDFNGSLSHELTHFIKDTAPESYRLYQEIVTEAQMKATGKAWEDLVESYTNRYKDAGQDLTRQQVMEEIAADATQKFLNDPDFIDQVVKKDRNLAQKIIDFLSDVIDSIKNLIKTGSTRAAAKNLEQDVQMYEDARYAWLLGLEQGSKDYKAGKERADNIMQSSKYELNQFGFEEYGEKEKGWWKNNDSIIICNTKQDIADFYRDHVHKKPYARLYIGKIGPELAQRIYKDTGVNTENLNVAITSEFEDSHSNPEKERSRGQTPVTPEILSRLPEIISSYDKVENTTSSKDRKPVLKFEKDINGKNVAVEYVRSKKGMLELHTMYAWENKNSRSVSTTLTMPEKTDPYRTSETYSVITPATKDNIQPGTEKSKTRFQLDDVDDTMSERRIQALQDQNEALKQANDLLEQQFKLTDKDAVRTEDIKKVARNILKEYGSKYSSEILERNLSKLYQYIRGAGQVDGQAITEAATSMGKSILEKSVQKDTELTEHYKDLRKQIKDTKIAITDQDKADLASVGGYNEFRKRYFGKMKMGADGISIDSLYQELQGQYPELFPADVTHPADELVAIASALDQTAPQIKNPYAANMDEMAYMVGQDILSSYFDVRKPSATFADKKEAQMQKLRWQYQQKIRDYKNDLKSKYDESLKQIKKQNLEESARLAEQYKNLTEAERKEQREYYKKRMDDLRNSKNQELAAMQQRSKERIKERIKSLRENQQKREDKRQIIKERKKLQNWLLKPTDSKHIPEGLRQSVAAFLNNIDFSPNDEDSEIKTQRKEDWKAAQDAFKEILDNGGVYVDQKTGDTMTMDIDPDIAQRIQELIEKTKGIDKLDNLDAYSMGELKKTVMAMKKAITEVNDLKSNKKSGELSILADGVFRDLEQRRNKVEYVGPAGMGDKLLNYDMLDPQTMFGKMGDNMKSTYDALRNGLDKKTEKLRSAQEYVDDIVDKYGIKPKELREWTGSNAKTQHFKTSRGEIDLTVAQVMSLYELNKRSQARGHMYDRNGGIKQAPVVGKAKLEGTTYTPAQIKKNYRPVKVTAADVETITKTLTPAQRALADGLQQFMGDQCAAWGNEVTMDMYGYEKFTAKNYFPISTDKNYVATRQGDAGNKASTIKNMGITKSTTPYANNPLIIEDIFDVFSRQVDNMSTYNAYVIPLSDLNKVYNYKDTRGMTEFGSSIKEEIERTFGKQGNDYIVKLVSDINGTVNKDKSIASQLVSNMKAASVAGNLRVAAQQPTAYIRASMEINPKYLARGATTITRKGQWDLICKYAPIAQWKDWGFYRMDTSRQMKDIMFNTDSTKQRFVNATMILAEKGDQLAWNRLWRACEYECMDQHPDLKEGTEEFYERVGKRFSEVVDKTQVVDSILHRTQIMRSQSEINQLATSFMAEPLKTYDMLYRAATDVKTKKEGSKSRAVRAATVFVLTGVATSIAASAVDMLRDDDRDKNSKEKYIDSLKSNIFDNLNLLNNIPWVKEIPSIIAGYTPTRADLSGFEDMIYAWNQIKKLKDGTSKYTPQYVAVYTAQMASKLTGIPIKSLTRDMGAVIDSIFDSAGGKADYTWLKQKYDMGSKENLEMYTKMMIQAHRNGDQDFQKKIKDDLNKAGIDNDTITNKIKTVIKSELIGKDSVNPLVEAAAQAKQSYDLEAYEDAVSQLTSQGYATKIVKSAIDARIKQLEGKEEIDWEAEVQTEPDSLYGDILTDQGASEDSSSVKFYSNSDLLAAIGQYDNKNAKSLDPFKKMADAIVKSKVDEGKTQKEAAGSIKTSITSHYKPLWIAADRKGREEIQNVLKQLKVNGKALYTGEDWTNWNKAAKKKQKKQ